MANKHKVLIIGAGKIGSLIAGLLHDSGDYTVFLADRDFIGADCKRLLKVQSDITTFAIDISQDNALDEILNKNPVDAIISCLPYHLNLTIANTAKKFTTHYFDLTEDTKTTATIKQLAQDATHAFVPQCGIAPGFSGIVANSLMQDFDALDYTKIRVGALPAQANNMLHYSLTWSTEGIINQYGNICHAIYDSEKIDVRPLKDLEAIQIDGMDYEAFNTSGGIGSLIDLYAGKIKKMNYKTIRYPGHCKLMRFLMQGLHLNDDRATLKRILENAIPKTYQDVVIILVVVTGQRHGEYIEESFVKKIYPQTLFGLRWSAIQISTAAGLCVVLDLLLNNEKAYQGFVYQEQFVLNDVLQNRFGKIFN